MDFAQQQRSPVKHVAGFTFVVIFHALLIYGFVNGLAHKVVEVIRQPLETKIIEEVKKLPPELPAPPPPKLLPPPPAYVPPPEVKVSIAPPPATTITTVTTSVPSEAPPTPPVAPVTPATVVRTNPSVGRCPDSDSIYPASARRLEQEGTVLLRVLIGVDGHVVESEIEKSSGFPSLDEAARSAVKQCQGGKPGTAEGRAEQAWVKLKYTFRIQ